MTTLDAMMDRRSSHWREVLQLARQARERGDLAEARRYELELMDALLDAAHAQQDDREGRVHERR